MQDSLISQKMQAAVESSGVSMAGLARVMRKSPAQTYNYFQPGNPQAENNPIVITLAVIRYLKSEELAKAIIKEAARLL